MEDFYQPHHRTPENISPASFFGHSLTLQSPPQTGLCGPASSVISLVLLIRASCFERELLINSTKCCLIELVQPEPVSVLIRRHLTSQENFAALLWNTVLNDPWQKKKKTLDLKIRRRKRFLVHNAQVECWMTWSDHIFPVGIMVVLYMWCFHSFIFYSLMLSHSCGWAGGSSSGRVCVQQWEEAGVPREKQHTQQETVNNNHWRNAVSSTAISNSFTV